jgi:hypothetical protein
LTDDVFEVESVDRKVQKRKRDSREPAPSTSKVRPSSRDDSKPKELAAKDPKVSKEQRDAMRVQEIVKDMKLKRSKEPGKLLVKEISPPPLPPPIRKRSPSRRDSKKPPRLLSSDPEFKPTTEKSSRSSKPTRSDDSRTAKRSLSTSSQSATDERRRKVRRVEKNEDKGVKEAETPTKKKPINLFPTLPTSGGPCLSNLKNFRIPKVVDAETTKPPEKEKEAPDPPPTASVSTEKEQQSLGVEKEKSKEKQSDRQSDRGSYYSRGGSSTYHYPNRGANYEGSSNDRGHFRRRAGAKPHYDERYPDYPSQQNPGRRTGAPPYSQHKKSITDVGDR